MADWEVALDKQIDTWLFLNSPKGDAYLDAYIADVEKSYPWEVPGWKRMGDTARATLWEAEPIYVTSEMMSLLEAAWPQFQPEPLSEEEIIIPTGFLYLPRPVHINDARGKDFAWRAVGWKGVTFSSEGEAVAEDNKRGVMVTFFSHPADKDGYWEAAQAQGREGYFGSALAVAHQMPLLFGDDGSYTDRMQQVTKTLEEKGMRPVEASEVKRSVGEIFQFCQALWRLMGQRVAVGMRSRPGRHARKRAEKQGMDEKYVTVVTLRRPRQQGEADHRKVDWQMRWIVSGHWRWQPYGDGTHRQIWISPYAKGPADKPLVIRGARVFRWAR